MNWRTGVAATVVIAAAAFVWHHLPTNSQIYAPFDVSADAGAAATGRNVAATVHGIQITPVIRPENAAPSQLEATGIWVVVDVAVSAISEPGLLRAELEVGPDTYTPTDRLMPSAGLVGTVQPAIERRGAFAFDVAPQALDTADTVSLKLWLGDARLDSRLVIRIPLDQVGRLETVRVPRPVVSAS